MCCFVVLGVAWPLLLSPCNKTMCRIFVSVLRGCCVGLFFGFARFAIPLAAVLYWVDRCFDSWVLPGLRCLLRVTQSLQTLVMPFIHATS